MARQDGFNDAILAAIPAIQASWGAKGYDLGSYFTHPLAYGPDGPVNANHPPKTMCVAAVTEVILAALTDWFKQTNDRAPFDKLPVTSWQRGSKRDIRAHVFMYDGLKCNGTAHALERFGIGRLVKFSEAQPGDFINFNRAHSGHACVFLAYIDGAGNDLAAFGPDVKGFRYFSAQGKGQPDGGLGYRWAFFEGNCPESLPDGKKRDCGVIKSDKPELFCVGYLFHPANWPAAVDIEKSVRDALPPGATPLGTPEEREAEFARELEMPDMSRFDGVTTD